jgi:site-specific DNA recombinase
MKRAVIYARVSTEQQEEQKTIESQLAELREICKKDEVKIVKEYIDDGWSGSTLARPSLDQLRDDASKGLFDVIYIHSQDRLARDHIDLGMVERELMRKGIEIVYYNRPLTEDSKLESDMKALFAEHERRLILERTRRGKLHKAKQGFIVGGVPPYGYEYAPRTLEEKGHFKINKEEAKIVRQIFELYLRLKSVREVVRELTRLGIRPRQGKQWRNSTLHRLLRNTAYIGTIYYNKRRMIELENSKRKYSRRVKTGVRWRNREEWIPIKVPPILDEQLFTAVQELLKKNAKSLRKPNSPYLLSSLIKCGNCGSTYGGEKFHGVAYYRCNNRHRTFPLSKNCHAKSIKAEKIDKVVWDTVFGAMSNPKLMISAISELANKMVDSEKLLNEEKAEILREKERLAYKKSKAIDLYTDDRLSKEELYQKFEEFDKKGEELNRRLKDIEIRLTQLSKKPSLIKQIEHFCKLTKERPKNLTFEEKQEILKLVIDKIIYYSHQNRIEIIGYIPLLETLSKEEVEKLKWEDIFIPQKLGYSPIIP